MLTALCASTILAFSGCATERVLFEEVELEVSPARSSIVVGQTLQLHASTVATRQPVAAEWSLDARSVASVSPNGLVTAIAPGTVVVAAQINGGSAEAHLIVLAPQPAPPTEQPPTQPTPEPEQPLPPTTPIPSVGAELPRVFLDTRYTAPVGGTTRTVRAGDNLQTVLDAARGGDIILLEAGATFVGNFVLPARAAGNDAWIVIRSAAPDAQLPAEGSRIRPSYAPVLPKLVTPNVDPALRTVAGTHHWRIIGVEITASSAATLNYGLVALGDAQQASLSAVPHNIIFDRVYIHGTPTLNMSRCIALNSASTSVIDSYVSECHGRGFDSQAICGWNGPGPFKIVNNYLEGAGENVMFGGSPASINGLIPSDIEFRRNHVYKPESWRGVWSVKNLFETKNARRMLVEGNIFENNWVDGQDGFAIVLKSSPDGEWMLSNDFTFRANRIINSPSAVNLANQRPGNESGRVARIVFEHNVFERISGRLWQMIDLTNDITFRHNTGFPGRMILSLDGSTKVGLRMENNIVGRGEYGIFGSGKGEGKGALVYYTPDAVVRGNVMIAAPATAYPLDNFYPLSPEVTGFVDYLGGNYRLLSTSPYVNKGIDGLTPGANIDTVERATAGVRIP